VFVDSFFDDLTYVRDVKVCMECMICYKPWSICYGSEDFSLSFMIQYVARECQCVIENEFL